VLSSVKLDLNPNGTSKGFGYVCFNEVEDAKRAEEELNDKEIEGRVLSVCKFVKKAERIKANRKAADKNKKFEGSNNNL